MMHNKLLRTLLLLALAVTVMLTASGCNLVMQWLFAPVKVDYSADAKERIERDIGIEPPSENYFVTGYDCPGRESVSIYIFEFPYENSVNNPGQYVRDLLGLPDTFGRSAYAIDKYNGYATSLADLGFTFTHYFDKLGYFSQVQYCINGDTLQVALICAR